MFVLKATSWKDKASIDRRIDEVLDKVGMKTKGFKFPYQLSGGEQQRIAIARALLNDPELILADEPTGNLDPQTSVEVMEVLQEISKNGNTILMATHDYALLLKYPSKTLKCDGERVFEVVQKRFNLIAPNPKEGVNRVERILLRLCSYLFSLVSCLLSLISYLKVTTKL